MSYRIDPRLPLTAEIRRIAEERIGKAIDRLTLARTDHEKGFHECRKRLKELRALFRLVRSGAEDFCRAENARYRDVALTLASAREATALIETIDRVAGEFPDDVAAGELDAVRAAFTARRAELLHGQTKLGAIIDAATSACEEGRAALADLALPDDAEGSADILADGARKAMRRAARALEAARKDGKPEDFHELRKSVKTHGMQVSLLHAFWPRPVRSRRKAVDALGEHLGELNDISVMLRLIMAEGKALGTRKDLTLLRRLLKRSEKPLRKQCLKQAKRLFGEPPKPKKHEIAKNFQASADMLEPARN